MPSKAKTCHSFTVPGSIVPLFCWFLVHRVAGPWFIAEMRTGSGKGIGSGNEAIHCVWRLNKELIVDKFRHFSSAVCVLSISIPWHQRTCLTLSWNQFILCEIIVLMAASSPLFLVRSSFAPRPYSVSTAGSTIIPAFGFTNQPRVQPLTARAQQTHKAGFGFGIGLGLGLGAPR